MPTAGDGGLVAVPVGWGAGAVVALPSAEAGGGASSSLITRSSSGKASGLVTVGMAKPSVDPHWIIDAHANIDVLQQATVHAVKNGLAAVLAVIDQPFANLMG